MRRSTLITLTTGLLLGLALAAPQPARAGGSAAEASLKQFFARGVEVNGARAELIAVNHWPATAGRLHWSLPRLAGHPARFSLIAEQGRGQNLRRWYVPVRVHWWAQAVVARRNLPARSLLDPSMLTTKRTDIAGHADIWWRKPAYLAGMRLMRPIQEGETIFSQYVRQMPMIRRGDLVTILIDTGRLRVSAEGEALRSAGRGERVLVRNIRSHQTVQAVAEQKGVVRIRLAGVQG